MPAMDEFLNAQAEEQVELFEAQEVQSIEAGVKAQAGRLAFTVNGFYTKLKNITSQGAIIDTATGGVTWIIETAPETRSYGAEIEVVALEAARCLSPDQIPWPTLWPLRSFNHPSSSRPECRIGLPKSAPPCRGATRSSGSSVAAGWRRSTSPRT
jgi:hypothetical protein